MAFLGTGFSALRSALEADDNDSDCVITSMRTPTDEQRARAEKYQLPVWFFMYEDDDAPKCPGCIGCDPDAFDFETIGAKKGKNKLFGSRYM